MQITVLQQERFDLRSISPVLPYLWLLPAKRHHQRFRCHLSSFLVYLGYLWNGQAPVVQKVNKAMEITVTSNLALNQVFKD